MDQFNEDHQTRFGIEDFTRKIEAPIGGYPDMGNGLHGAKLSYKDWFEF